MKLSYPIAGLLDQAWTRLRANTKIIAESNQVVVGLRQEKNCHKADEFQQWDFHWENDCIRWSRTKTPILQYTNWNILAFAIAMCFQYRKRPTQYLTANLPFAITLHIIDHQGCFICIKVLLSNKTKLLLSLRWNSDLSVKTNWI